jgi:hypothetical protein
MSTFRAGRRKCVNRFRHDENYLVGAAVPGPPELPAEVFSWEWRRERSDHGSTVPDKTMNSRDNDSTLKQPPRRSRWFVRLFFNFSGLLLAYAIFDTVATWLRVQVKVSEALDEHIIISPMPLLENSFILLAAAIAFKIGTRLGRVTSFCCAWWILYRGVEGFMDVAIADELPAWSLDAVKKWWAIGPGAWDFVRQLIAGLIVMMVLVRTVRHLFWKGREAKGARLKA